MTQGEDRTRADQHALLLAARAGDERAFASLLEDHQSGLELFCHAMLGDPDAASQAMVEIALSAWRDRQNVPSQTTVRMWLYRIAAHACIGSAEDPR